MSRQISQSYYLSGAKPFAPHEFSPKQIIINHQSVPKVFILPEAYADMVAIAELSGRDEIGWLGSVSVIDECEFLIEKIFMVKQSVHGSTTEMSDEGLADLFTDLADTVPELCAQMLFWGHVHPANSTTPSSQDEDQMELFNHNDWFIRGIFGRGGRAEFDFFDYRRGVVWKDIPWQVYAPISQEVRDYWKAEIDAKVTKLITVTPVVHKGRRFNKGLVGLGLNDEEDDNDSPSLGTGISNVPAYWRDGALINGFEPGNVNVFGDHQNSAVLGDD